MALTYSPSSASCCTSIGRAGAWTADASGARSGGTTVSATKASVTKLAKTGRDHGDRT
jgi:hypothetical protein